MATPPAWKAGVEMLRKPSPSLVDTVPPLASADVPWKTGVQLLKKTSRENSPARTAQPESVSESSNVPWKVGVQMLKRTSRETSPARGQLVPEPVQVEVPWKSFKLRKTPSSREASPEKRSSLTESSTLESIEWKDGIQLLRKRSMTPVTTESTGTAIQAAKNLLTGKLSKVMRDRSPANLEQKSVAAEQVVLDKLVEMEKVELKKTDQSLQLKKIDQAESVKKKQEIVLKPVAKKPVEQLERKPEPAAAQVQLKKTPQRVKDVPEPVKPIELKPIPPKMKVEQSKLDKDQLKKIPDKSVAIDVTPEPIVEKSKPDLDVQREEQGMSMFHTEESSQMLYLEKTESTTSRKKEITAKIVPQLSAGQNIVPIEVERNTSDIYFKSSEEKAHQSISTSDLESGTATIQTKVQQSAEIKLESIETSNDKQPTIPPWRKKREPTFISLTPAGREKKEPSTATSSDEQEVSIQLKKEETVSLSKTEIVPEKVETPVSIQATPLEEIPNRVVEQLQLKTAESTVVQLKKAPVTKLEEIPAEKVSLKPVVARRKEPVEQEKIPEVVLKSTLRKAKIGESERDEVHLKKIPFKPKDEDEKESVTLKPIQLRKEAKEEKTKPLKDEKVDILELTKTSDQNVEPTKPADTLQLTQTEIVQPNLVRKEEKPEDKVEDISQSNASVVLQVPKKEPIKKISEGVLKLNNEPTDSVEEVSTPLEVLESASQPSPQKSTVDEPEPEGKRLKSISLKKQQEDKKESVQLKPVPRRSEPEKEKIQEIVLKPTPQKPKLDDQVSDEMKLIKIPFRETEDEQKEAVRLKPIPRRTDVKEEKIPEVTLKPIPRKTDADETEQETTQFKKVPTRKLAHEAKETVQLNPIPSQNEPVQENIQEVLNISSQNKTVVEVETIDIKAKKIQLKKQEEIPVESVSLKPVPAVLKKPEEPKKIPEIVLKPSSRESKMDKPEQDGVKPPKVQTPEVRKEPEGEPISEIVIKPEIVRKPKEKEERVEVLQVKNIPLKDAEDSVKESVKLKPVPAKKQPEGEIPKVVLKPIQQKAIPDEAVPEEIQLKEIPLNQPVDVGKVSVQLTKPIPPKEEPKEEQTSQMTLESTAQIEKINEPEAEIAQLKKSPLSKPVDAGIESIQLKPVSIRKKPEETQVSEVVLKPVPTKPKTKEPELEEIQLKSLPLQKPEDKTKELIQLKPTPQRTETQEEKLPEILLKPTPKKKEVVEQKPDRVELRKFPLKKPEDDGKESVQLKPIPARKQLEDEAQPEVILKQIPLKPKPEQQEAVPLQLREVSEKKVEDVPSEKVTLQPILTKEKSIKPIGTETKSDISRVNPVLAKESSPDESDDVASAQLKLAEPAQVQLIESIATLPEHQESVEAPREVPWRKKPSITVQPEPVISDVPVQEKVKVNLKPITTPQALIQPEVGPEVKLKPIPQKQKPESVVPVEVDLKKSIPVKTSQTKTPEESALKRTPEKPEQETKLECVPAAVPITPEESPIVPDTKVQTEKVQLQPELKPVPVVMDEPATTPQMTSTSNVQLKMESRNVPVVSQAAKIDTQTILKTESIGQSVTMTTTKISRTIQQTEQEKSPAKLKKASLVVAPKFQPPVFTKKLQPLSSRTGKKVRLNCQFQGEPEPTITWYRNESVLLPTADRLEITMQPGNSVLEISQIVLEDTGIYTCRAVNEAGTAITSANLIVQGKLTFISLFY